MLLLRQMSCSDKYQIELGQEQFSVELSLAHIPVWSWTVVVSVNQPIRSSFAEKDQGVLTR